jgi:hypothetical protein
VLSLVLSLFLGACSEISLTAHLIKTAGFAERPSPSSAKNHNISTTDPDHHLLSSARQ